MGDYFSTDEYLEYLKKNCGVRGYDLDDRSAVSLRPDVDVILRYVELLKIRPSDSFLEVGCGLGRILKEIHEGYGIKPCGIDPERRIIEAARERVGAICDELRVSPAEAVGFEANRFDKVLCWGTFDLTEQEKSLPEMGRVTKLGGLLMVTGKNDDYQDDDREAYLAEVAARNKGIPNHFTDYEHLIQFASEVGLEKNDQYFFARRGDFMNDVALKRKPDRFYEYLVIFKKIRDTGSSRNAPRSIGLLFSATFRRLNPQSMAATPKGI